MERMPSKEEIARRALELYYEEHPEAIEHRLTPDVEKELRPPEGYYYLKAQQDLMTSHLSEMEQALHFHEEEAQELRETLGIKPPPDLEQLTRKLELLEAKVERVEREKRKAEQQLAGIKESLERREEELKTTREALAEKRKIEERYIFKMATVKFIEFVPAFMGSDRKTYGPYYAEQLGTLTEPDAETLIREGKAQPWVIPIPKPAQPPEKEALRQEAEELWKTYRHAILSYDTQKAQQTLNRLKEIRGRLFSL